jgi:hypothetical protein
MPKPVQKAVIEKESTDIATPAAAIMGDMSAAINEAIKDHNG